MVGGRGGEGEGGMGKGNGEWGMGKGRGGGVVESGFSRLPHMIGLNLFIQQNKN